MDVEKGPLKVPAEKLHLGLLISFMVIFLWSGINPKDSFTWILEVLPAAIGLLAVIATYNKFRLTKLLYILIWVHGIILVVGGHYTYAEMPLFNWVKDFFHLERNYYDRLGHLAQGFVPAMIAREILLRISALKPGKLLNFIVISISLAISAFYELIEWWVAELTGTAAEAFLGTQGDIWDTQWDMFCALIGSVAALTLLTRVHNRLLKN